MILNSSNILYGVIEDNHSDPLKLGRCKVRCFNIHDETKVISGHKGIPTKDLPWAVPLIDLNHGLISGIGKSPTRAKQGSTVLVISKDDLYQDLIIVGVIPGIFRKASDKSLGFNDPDGVFPLSNKLQEPDTNRLARGENINSTIVADKASRTINNIPIAGGGSWSEPNISSYFGPEYPFNSVEETENGHVIEIDDTPGKSRISTWHNSGAFDETINSGERIIKVPSNFYISVEDGYYNVFAESGVNITTNGDICMKAGGSIILESENGIAVHSNGDLDLKSGGDASVNGNTVSLN